MANSDEFLEVLARAARQQQFLEVIEVDEAQARLHADDTALASDISPCRLRLNEEIVTPGVVPVLPAPSGTATLIATGAMLPRGSDAVTMIEHTEPAASSPDGGRWIELRRPVAPGAALAAAGGDIGRGESVLRAGAVLTLSLIHI